MLRVCPRTRLSNSLWDGDLWAGEAMQPLGINPGCPGVGRSPVLRTFCFLPSALLGARAPWTAKLGRIFALGRFINIFANNSHAIGTMGFLQHISSRTRDFTRGCSMKTPLRLLHVIDNLQVEQQTHGRWSCGFDNPYASFVHFLRWGYHVFQHVWKFSPPNGYAHCMEHKLRHLNSYADWLANHAVDVNEVLSGFRSIHVYSGDVLCSALTALVAGTPGWPARRRACNCSGKANSSESSLGARPPLELLQKFIPNSKLHALASGWSPHGVLATGFGTATSEGFLF